MKVLYDVIDCKDKLVIIKGPVDLIYQNLDSFKNVAKLFKTCGAEKTIFAPNDIDFETMSKDEAIYKINDYINFLHELKEELLEDEENE